MNSSCGVQLEWNIKDGRPPSTSVLKQESTWLLEKSFKLPSGLDVNVQAGTKDYILEYKKKPVYGKILSDYALRKKYR